MNSLLYWSHPKSVFFCFLSIIIVFLSHIYAEEESERLSLERYLPPDTGWFVAIDDLSDATEIFEGSELLARFKEDEFKPLLDSILQSELFAFLDGMTVDGEPLTWELFTEHYPDQLIAGINGVYQSEETEQLEPSFYFLAHYEGSLDFLLGLSMPDMDSDDGSTINFIEEDYLGVTLYLQEIEWEDEVSVDNGWALIKDVYIEASPVSFLKEMVERVLNDDSNDSLLANENYQSVADNFKDCDFYTFLNIASLIPEALSLIRKHVGELPPNPLGVTLDNLIAALHLELLKSFYASVTIEDEVIAVESALSYEERRGILGLLAYQHGKIPEVNFIPEDVFSAGVSLFSFPQAIAALETILKDMSPNFESFYDLQLENLKAQIGIDIRESIIGNIGHELISYSSGYESTGENSASTDEADFLLNQVYALQLIDVESIKAALNVLISILGNGSEFMEERDYLGATIYAPKANAGHNVSTYSYAFADDYLLFAIGHESALEEPIQLMQTSKFSFFDSDAVVVGQERLAENPSEIKYSDIDRLWHVVVAYLKNITSTAPDAFPIDLNALSDDFNLPFYLLSQLYIDEHELKTQLLIAPKVEEEK